MGPGLLHVKFIAYTLYGGNAVEIELLPYFTDMYIYGAVTYNYFGAPYLV